MAKHRNTSARLEKKLSSTAKSLLLALYPKTFSEKDFYLEEGYYEGYRGTVWHQEWHHSWPVDYWGESDSDDCFWLLYSWLIDNTTDFEGMNAADELVGWDWGIEVDYTPFYSPWRGAGRAAIIGHCRRLVKASVTLDCMR
ncbi:hypothetical protein [Pantoea sp. R13S299]|uniref:hypothetical protein n=1 Tax=Pantoea sp. R13S299 TaxID=3402751 RepID=UPI003AE7C8D6